MRKDRASLQSARRSYQFWSPLLMTEDAKHSFSLTDHGSVGPRASTLCSAGEHKKKKVGTTTRIPYKYRSH